MDIPDFRDIASLQAEIIKQLEQARRGLEALARIPTQESNRRQERELRARIKSLQEQAELLDNIVRIKKQAGA